MCYNSQPLSRQYKLDKAQNKEAGTGAQCKAYDGQINSLQSRIEASEKEVLKKNSELEHYHDELETLHHEIDSLHRDVDQLSKQRQTENDIWANKFVAIQAELASNQEEWKDKYNSAVSDAKKRTVDAVEDRRRAEEQFHAAQDSAVALHDSMDELRREHQSYIESSNQTKNELGELVTSLRRQGSAKDVELEGVY
jgi:chromosome segregation ATPase